MNDFSNFIKSIINAKPQAILKITKVNLTTINTMEELSKLRSENLVGIVARAGMILWKEYKPENALNMTMQMWMCNADYDDDF